MTLATVLGVPNIDGCRISGIFKVSGKALFWTVGKARKLLRRWGLGHLGHFERLESGGEKLLNE